jgi:hypothetical protein
LKNSPFARLLCLPPAMQIWNQPACTCLSAGRIANGRPAGEQSWRVFFLANYLQLF